MNDLSENNEMFRRLMKVKICGITNREDAIIAVKHGADAVGAVVDVPVKAPRKITAEKAKEIFSSVPVFVSTVAVVMPRTLDDASKIIIKANPDIIQLQGYESPEFVCEIKNKFPNLKIIKVVHIEGRDDFNKQKIDKILNEITDYKNAGASAVVLDTKTKSGIGGTGKVHNWNLSKVINEKIDIPLILAGGLNPENVKEAVVLVKPYAVDVSSGVEAVLCKKDREKVRKFIEEARSLS